MVIGDGAPQQRHGFGKRGRCLGLAVGLLVIMSGTAAAASRATEAPLSATLVGRLEPGEQGRVAVWWDGSAGQLLDVWVDLDDDGQPAPQELVADGRPLAPGIEVVTFDFEPGARVVAEPRVRVRARAGGSDWGEEAAATDACATDRGACA